MRILAIDFGEKRVGLALSDPLGFTAQGFPTIQRKSKRQVIAEILEVIRQNQVSEIVIGLPINMNGTSGFKAEETLRFVRELEEASKMTVKTWDERLTSKEASRLMIEEGLSRQKQRMNSDRLAATLILQNYLEFKRSQERR